MSPENVVNLRKLGFQVFVENSGSLANFSNEDYTKSGAVVVPRSQV